MGEEFATGVRAFQTEEIAYTKARRLERACQIQGEASSLVWLAIRLHKRWRWKCRWDQITKDFACDGEKIRFNPEQRSEMIIFAC